MSTYEYAWMMLYCSLVSMQHHPGVKARLPKEEIARMTDWHFSEYEKRFEVGREASRRTSST